MLEVKDISKYFKKKEVLKGVSCQFPVGITALLGPNGAGKSTLINIICTLLEADSGAIYYAGKSISELQTSYLEKLGVQFQNQPMQKNYTAEEYLEFCGILKGLSQVEIETQGTELLQYFGLEQNSKKKISAYSGGMKQRLALCGTFLGNPQIIILDEPSVGLDIYEREELKRLLFELKRDRTIIICTHIVSDIENIADQIVLLNRGEIYTSGTQQELIEDIEGDVWEISANDMKEVSEKIYHSDGKILCIAAEKPCEGAQKKKADLTDVYFNCLKTR